MSDKAEWFNLAILFNLHVIQSRKAGHTITRRGKERSWIIEKATLGIKSQSFLVIHLQEIYWINFKKYSRVDLKRNILNDERSTTNVINPAFVIYCLLLYY